jgi:hypothetical protein
MEGTVYRPGRGCTGRLSAGLDHNRPEGEWRRRRYLIMYVVWASDDILSQVWGSHHGAYQDYGLLGCDAVYFGIWVLIFRVDDCAADLSKTSVPIYQTIRRHAPEYRNLDTAVRTIHLV